MSHRITGRMVEGWRLVTEERRDNQSKRLLPE